MSEEIQSEIETPIEVPEGWCEPTYELGETVFHQCHPYRVTGAVANAHWELWSYQVEPIDHNETPEWIVEGALLEHQVGREPNESCSNEQPNQSDHGNVATDRGTPGYSEASGVWN